MIRTKRTHSIATVALLAGLACSFLVTGCNKADDQAQTDTTNGTGAATTTAAPSGMPPQAVDAMKQSAATNQAAIDAQGKAYAAQAQKRTGQ